LVNLALIITLSSSSSSSSLGSDMASEFLHCARYGNTLRLKELLKGDSELIMARDELGNSALLLAAEGRSVVSVEFLLEYGGANVLEANDAGNTVWSLFRPLFDLGVNPALRLEFMSPVLRVMVLQQAPPFDMSSPEHAELVLKGARLRERLPAFLARRRALVDKHCPLIAPLLVLVQGYDMPLTTEEIWATGLDEAS
jgi:hypothetical protein